MSKKEFGLSKKQAKVALDAFDTNADGCMQLTELRQMIVDSNWAAPQSLPENKEPKEEVIDEGHEGDDSEELQEVSGGGSNAL